jgi:hypothetical protein
MAACKHTVYIKSSDGEIIIKRIYDLIGENLFTISMLDKACCSKCKMRFYMGKWHTQEEYEDIRQREKIDDKMGLSVAKVS